MLKYRKQLNDFIHGVHTFVLFRAREHLALPSKKGSSLVKRHSSRPRKANSYRDARDTFEQSIYFQKETYIYRDVILERDMKIDKLIELIFHIVQFRFFNLE